MLPAWSVVYGFVFGAVVGSFLNVLIYRLPNRLSILFPPSHCPACQHRLGVRDLVPLFSFLLQRARCRYCGASIAWRYFFVELWNASLWAYFWWLYFVQRSEPELLSFLAYALGCSLLLAIFFIDLRHYIIPDELNVALLILALLYSALAGNVQNGWEWTRWGGLSWQNALIGAEVSAGVFCLITLLGRLLFRKDAMGHGDIKLARAVGAWLMLPRALAAFGLAVALGAVTGVGWLLYQNRQRAAGSEQQINPESGIRNPEPEPIGALFIMCLFYLLWLDVPLALLPARAQERFYDRLGQRLGAEVQGEEDGEEPVIPGMLPFGPFIVLGVLAVLLFNEQVLAAIQAYLNWAFPNE